MWNRKELKTKARSTVKKNYWTIVLVCFILALLTEEFGTSMIGWIQEKDTLDPIYIINDEAILQDENVNHEQINKMKKEIAKVETEINNIKEKLIPDNLKGVETKILEMMKANVNSMLKTQKYIVKIWDAITSFNINAPFLGITLSLTAVIAAIYNLIIRNPLIVAGRKYFLVAREGENVKTIGIASEIFKWQNWINVAIIMFLKNFYNFLWYITIIGGPIKTYEYRMIPYILAEKPETSIKEAFKTSKKMMKKNKWRAFVLDLSFIGWEIASILTFGILNILYTNPYKSMTCTELYVALKNNEEIV